MRPLLLLVDLQNDFLSAPGLEPARGEIIRGAARLLAGARVRSVPVVHAVTAVHPEADDRMPHWKVLGRWACVQGTLGQAPPVELAPAGAEAVVSKTFFSAFSSPDLDSAIARAGADMILLAGVHLHGCVRATVLDAYQRGLTVCVAEDAVGSDDPLHAAITRRYLEGRAARFAPAEQLLAELSSGRGAVTGADSRLPAALIGGRIVRRDGLPAVVHRSPREVECQLFAVPVGGREEAAEASGAARAARRDWNIPPEERSRRLVRLAELLEEKAPQLARDLAVDVGKPLIQGQGEVRRAAALLRAAPSSPEGKPFSAGPASSWRRVPLGVVAIVTPWNNPVAIPLGKIGPAVSLGNAVVWKPAPAGMRVAIEVASLARQAGLPDGLLNLVAGDHRTAAVVMSDGGIDGVSLSGSSGAGWAAQEICSRRRVPLQAELGGNNAAIVWEGADLPRTAELLARGAFSFAGQRCTANRRVVADARLFDSLVEQLTGWTAALRWGDPLDPATEVGPLISGEARARVEAAVARATAHADRILVPHGGRTPIPSVERGAYFPPTIVVGADRASEIVQEETFGPVLVLQRARDFEEALELCNGVRQGLVAALFSGPGVWRSQFRERARAGVLKWDAATADADALAPFGGWKESGLGPPERGPGDHDFYMRTQSLYGEA